MYLLCAVIVSVCLVCPVPVVGAAGPAGNSSLSSKARSCSDLRQFYTGKGFTLNGVPQTEISGKCMGKCKRKHPH